MEKKKKKIRILVVDDEEGFTNMMKLYLEKSGEYEVRAENISSKAIAVAREFKPNMVFLDVVMLDMDGPDVANQFKADKDLKDVPIVFLTATVESGQTTASSGGSIGGHAFLPKPISGEQIINCIKEHIK